MGRKRQSQRDGRLWTLGGGGNGGPLASLPRERCGRGSLAGRRPRVAKRRGAAAGATSHARARGEARGDPLRGSSPGNPREREPAALPSTGAQSRTRPQRPGRSSSMALGPTAWTTLKRGAPGKKFSIHAGKNSPRAPAFSVYLEWLNKSCMPRDLLIKIEFDKIR